jgi:hypothetical protein
MITLRAGVISKGFSVWDTSISYKTDDVILRGRTFYLCVSNHISGTFYLDWLTNGYWHAITDAPGRILETAGSGVEPGYLLCDLKSVGDSSSGADYAGDQYRELYERINNIWGGTYDWSNHDVIYLPDKRGVFTIGAGTTNRAAGVDALGNYYSGTLGSYTQDQYQGFKMYLKDAAGNTFGRAGGAGSGNYFTVSGVGAYTQLQVDVFLASSYGTPRVGNSTKPQAICTTFMIKY